MKSIHIISKTTIFVLHVLNINMADTNCTNEIYGAIEALEFEQLNGMNEQCFIDRVDFYSNNNTARLACRNSAYFY